jgi:hypothetical protein
MPAKLGFAATVGSTTHGVVSAIKLCRSAFVKGMEALAIEGLLTARRFGVEREVLASLAETFPGVDWERQAMWRSVVQHGRRRAEEMREAAVTVTDARLAPRMARASADVQQWIAMLRAEGVFRALAPMQLGAISPIFSIAKWTIGGPSSMKVQRDVMIADVDWDKAAPARRTGRSVPYRIAARQARL